MFNRKARKEPAQRKILRALSALAVYVYRIMDLLVKAEGMAFQESATPMIKLHALCPMLSA
jgi:hypothetical protein